MGDITALYYLREFFEFFDADQLAEEVEKKMQQYIQAVLTTTPTSDASWSDWYHYCIALFYSNAYDGVPTSIDTALSEVELPDWYRKDLLRRAFYITEDKKYIEWALEKRFKEFHIKSALLEKTLENKFKNYEQAIMEGEKASVAEAFFEAGKYIVRFGHEVNPDSPLWGEMSIANQDNMQLGISLLETSVTLGVSAGLEILIEHYREDEAKALMLCDLNKQPWAHYKKAQILEKQHKFVEAIASYKEAGELFGYADAARLSPQTEEQEILRNSSEFKQKMLDELSPAFNKKD